MAKNTTSASAKKQNTPPTPPVPGEENQGDQNTPTPPTPGKENQGDQNTTTPPTPGKENQGDQNTTTPPTPGEENQGEQNTPTPPISKFVAKCQEVAARYAVSYPTCKAFHFCTDMQVFLDADLREARAHQSEIDEGEVVTINID